MLRTSVLALAFAGAVCSFLPAAHAGKSSGSGPGAPVGPAEVRAWLMRIHAAASRRNFQGTFIVSVGGGVSSARIAHYNDGHNQFERIESLDGETRFVFRHNDEVRTLWPDQRVALIEQRDLLTSFPALLQVSDDRIVDFYEVHARGVERIAGYEASVLMLRPRDAHRYGYRLWADRATGLLLRADVLGERGELLESSAFSDVAIDVRSQPETVLQPMSQLDGYRILRPVLTHTRLEAEGWALRQAVPGFRLVSCVRRPMLDIEPAANAPAPTALQTIYSDGLTYVSVFIEPFDAARHETQIDTSIGATHTLMQRQGDWWITVVGDVPTATLRAFAVALERTR